MCAAEVFQLMGSLEEVVMPQNGIYHEGLTALAEAFSHNPNLRWVAVLRIRIQIICGIWIHIQAVVDRDPDQCFVTNS
jgi:hypothetical protein